MQQSKIIYLFLFDTLADWEIGYVVAGINNPMMQINPKKFQLKSFSIDGKPVRTISPLAGKVHQTTKGGTEKMHTILRRE